MKRRSSERNLLPYGQQQASLILDSNGLTPDSSSQLTGTTQGKGLVVQGKRLSRILFGDAGFTDRNTLFAVLASPSGKAFWVGASFIVFVVFPSIAVILYFAFIAAPQFSVEARLIVRAAESGSSPVSSVGSTVASLGSTLSFSPAAQNAHIVAQYVRSRAAVDDLQQLVDLRSMYRRPEADFWARLKDDASEEDLVQYWHQMVRAYVDAPSSIITLEVKAFRAEDALKIGQAILVISERLVNQMSQRARRDVMRGSEEEVRRADLLMRSALNDLQKARDFEGMLDPVKAADETGKLLAQLMTEKIRIDAELYFASRSLDKSAPSVRQLTSKAQIVDGQIAALRASLAGGNVGSSNVAASLRKFEELEVQRFLADKILTFAEDGLERARINAERQNLYFMVFVVPALPTKAALPRRLSYSLLFPIAFAILWGIAALMAAAIEDHRV